MPESPLQEIVCCMGQPVAGNPTQFMMERAFAAAGLDWQYLTLEVSAGNLGDAVRGMRAMGFRGANFLVPHKGTVLPYLDELTEAAQLVGAVNCVHRQETRLIGMNTEGPSFLQALRAVTDPAGKNYVILGAGEVARALAVEVGRAGAAEITIVNRTAERGQALVELLKERVKVAAKLVHLSGDYSVEESTHIVINATPIGQEDDEPVVPLDEATLRPQMVVADVVFNPPLTHLLRMAAARGCTTLDGVAMLVNQAIIGFRTWTGVEPDATTMREALEEYLEI